MRTRWMAGSVPKKAGEVDTNPGQTTTRKQVWICDICHRQIHNYTNTLEYQKYPCSTLSMISKDPYIKMKSRVGCLPRRCDSQYYGVLSIAPSGSKYKPNFIGPRTEPCGTPHSKIAKSDIIPSILTLSVRSQKI